MIQRLMRLCIWTQAITLVAIGAWGLLLILKSDDPDEWVPIVAYCSAVFLPPMLYVIFLRQFKRNSALRAKINLPLTISVFLYLPAMVAMATTPATLGGRRPLVAVVAPLILALVVWLLCSYLHSWLSAGDPASSDSETTGWLEKSFQSTKRLVSSPAMLLVGAILPLVGFLRDRDHANRILVGDETWLTAEYGLGYGLHAARVILAYVGRLGYAATLLSAVLVVVLLLFNRFSTTRLQKSWGVRLLTFVVVFLAILTVADYFYSWIWFLSGGRQDAIHFVLITLFLVQWVVPASFLKEWYPGRAGGGNAVESRRLAVLFYLPMLLFVVAMTPFFLDDTQFMNCASAYLGVVFLAFGVLGVSSTSQESVG